MTEINLKELNQNLPNTESSRSKFNHLIIKLKETKATVLLYKNGKFIVTGLKIYDKIQQAIDELYIQLLHNGIFFVARAWELINITITGSRKIYISLYKFKKENKDAVDYEHEIFPACVYTFPGTKTKALIFKSGKYIITGIKNFNEIRKFNSTFVNYIEKYIM